MEDELSVIPDFDDYVFAAVYDGHGGNQAAKWVNENLHEFVSSAVSQSQDVQAALRVAFQVADQELLSYLETASSEGELLTGAGTTASVVLADTSRVVVANIGDSSVMLSRKGQPETLTVAHRVYGTTDTERAEIERVRAAGGWIGDARVCEVLAVSRAFGDYEFKQGGTDTLLRDGVKYEWWTQEFADSCNLTGDLVVPAPAVTEREVSEEAGDEFLVAASDGLWDFYKPSDAMQFARQSLKSGKTAQQVAEGLVERALKRYTADNVSVIVLKFPWAFKDTSQHGKNAKRKGLFAK